MQLSIAHMKVKSETRLKPTLQTLPLEIKNEIFSHLLLGEKIKTLPCGRPPIAKYNWHTSILRVNKALGNEAKACLYSHNTFAIIRSDTTRLLKRIIECSLLPVVSYDPGKFKHHSLEVQLQYTDFVVPDCVQCPSSPGSDPRLVLLLQQDLRILCDQLALMQHSARSSSIFILSPPETKPTKMWSHFYPCKRYIVIEVRKNPLDPQLKAAEKKKKHEKLLKPFAVIRSHSQDVKIVGDVNQSLVDRTIQAMRPRIVWADAIAWDLHDRLRKEKARLDEILKRHPQAGASLYHAYHQLALFGGSGFLFQKPDDRTSIAEVTLPTETQAIKKSWLLGLLYELINERT